MTLPLTIVMISLHTSALDRPGQGDAGGMNVYIRQLAQALQDGGHQLMLVTRATQRHEDIMQDEVTGLVEYPVHAGALTGLAKEDLPATIPEFIRGAGEVIARYAQHPVVIHSHYWLSGLVAQALGEKYPWVHTMHTMGAVKNFYDPDAHEPQSRVEAEAQLVAAADALVANTELEKQELIRFCSADPESVEVIFPGVDHRVFARDGGATWPGINSAGALKILFAGRLQHHKGAHILVEALGILKELSDAGELPDVQVPVVHFAGAVSGQADYDISALAHARGVSTQVSFTPPVSRHGLAEMMRAADIVAVPSFSESFGLVALEAQATGTAVLAHQTGGLEIIIDDGRTGRLLDSLEPEAWARAVAELAKPTSAPLIKQWGEVGFERSQAFSWSRMAEQLSRVYREVMDA